MKTIIFLITALSIFSMVNIESEKQDYSDIKNAVVKVFVTCQEPDYDQPWQMKSHYEVTGSGCVIEGNRILTNAHVVCNHKYIQVQRSGDVNKYTAEVEFIGHDHDLAVLKLKEKKFFAGVKPVALGVLPYLKDRITVYGFPMGGNKLSITEGVISRIELMPYSHGRFSMLTIQIDAAINPGNSGGPVIKMNKLCGIAFQKHKGDNIGYIIPIPVINHFLKDISDGKSDGIPFIGIKAQNLENPFMRESLNMKSHQTGVYVRYVSYGSSTWRKIYEGDILLYFNNKKIENDGTFFFRDGDRVGWLHLPCQNQIGDSVKLKLIRKGKIIDKKITLKGYKWLVPRSQYDVLPTYYVFAGFVFIPITENYLRTWERMEDVPIDLDYYYKFEGISVGKKEKVVLSNILEHDINKGYQDFDNIIITHVNDKTIRSMMDLKQAIEKNENKFHSLKFENGFHLVLNAEAVRKHSKEIMEKYGVKNYCSKDLR